MFGACFLPSSADGAEVDKFSLAKLPKSDRCSTLWEVSRQLISIMLVFSRMSLTADSRF